MIEQKRRVRAPESRRNVRLLAIVGREPNDGTHSANRRDPGEPDGGVLFHPVCAHLARAHLLQAEHIPVLEVLYVVGRHLHALLFDSAESQRRPLLSEGPYVEACVSFGFLVPRPSVTACLPGDEEQSCLRFCLEAARM